MRARPGGATLTVNGSSGAITVSAGSVVNVGVQNGPGTPSDCIGVYPAGLPDVADGSFLNWFYLNGTKVLPSTGLTSATVAFPMPSTAGTYEFRLWQSCAINPVKSPRVTAQ